MGNTIAGCGDAVSGAATSGLSNTVLTITCGEYGEKIEPALSTVVVVGLDNAGKSTIVQHIKGLCNHPRVRGAGPTLVSVALQLGLWRLKLLWLAHD